MSKVYLYIVQNSNPKGEGLSCWTERNPKIPILFQKKKKKKTTKLTNW